MNKEDFYQIIKIVLIIGALILAIFWGLKILSIGKAILEIIEIKFGINYFVD